MVAKDQHQIAFVIEFQNICIQEDVVWSNKHLKHLSTRSRPYLCIQTQQWCWIVHQWGMLPLQVDWTMFASSNYCAPCLPNVRSINSLLTHSTASLGLNTSLSLAIWYQRIEYLPMRQKSSLRSTCCTPRTKNNCKDSWVTQDITTDSSICSLKKLLHVLLKKYT